MKAAGISEIKQELTNTPPEQLLELCIQLVKYKKENKELLSYLLFQSHDTDNYLKNVKTEMDELFAAINTANLYFVKKSLRKILRFMVKHTKYMASRQSEAELLIHFCNNLKQSAVPFYKSTALTNLYNQQVKKIKAAVALLHEDLQYDYLKQLEQLS